MAATVRWEGLDALKAELRKLPETLTGEARKIAEGAANGAAADIRRSYPVNTGKLRDGVVVEYQHAQLSANAVVHNKAPHAFIFENGTQLRYTDRGISRGAMPPGRVFIWRVMRARRKMYEDLKAMLTRHGAQVSGDA